MDLDFKETPPHYTIRNILSLKVLSFTGFGAVETEKTQFIVHVRPTELRNFELKRFTSSHSIILAIKTPDRKQTKLCQAKR